MKILFETSEAPNVDIVFAHGLQFGGTRNAWEDSWTSDEGVLWPRQWLGPDLVAKVICAANLLLHVWPLVDALAGSASKWSDWASILSFLQRVCGSV